MTGTFMLKHLKIRYKLLFIPFMAMIGFLLVYLAVNAINQRNEILLSQIEQRYYPSLELSRDLEEALGAIQRGMQDAVAAADEDMLNETDALLSYFLERLASGADFYIIDAGSLERLKQELHEYYTLARATSQQMIRGETGEKFAETLKTMTEKYNRVREILSLNSNRVKNAMSSSQGQARENNQHSTNIITLLTIGCIFLLGILSLVLARSFTKPLSEVAGVSTAFALGDVDARISVTSRDEIGELAQTINEMMTKIRASRAEVEYQNQLKTGLAELNNKIRGEQDFITLAQNTIGFLAGYLAFPIAALYFLEADKFKLIATYAYSSRKNLSNEYSFGEGIVGQCALERKPILLSNVPEDYISIKSGLGEKPPRYILVLPFSNNGEISGVIEFGAFEAFTQLQLDLLNQAAEVIGVVLNSAQTRVKMKTLLEKTQQQAEELQEQQEELRQTNEELEEQATALRESQARLEAQQEELKQSNAELEHQTELLAQQRDSIKVQNAALEKARTEIEKKASELEIASKYKSEFLANMSHELRTPLNSLLILSKLLYQNKDGNLTEKQVEFSRTIYSSGSDLLNLINDILDLSKVEAGKMELHPEDVPLKSLRDNLVSMFQYLAKEKNLEFFTEIPENLPQSIFTDGQRVEQVVKNLLSNAFKYTEKGSVTLRFHYHDDAAWLAAQGLKLKTAIAIAVTDTGIGLAEDKQKIIFEAFQQADGSTSRKYQGTGLGLSISRQMARLLGGEITLKSKPGEGSTFTFFLPVRQKQTSEKTAAENLAKTEVKDVQPPAEPSPITISRRPSNGDLKIPAGIQDDRENLSPADRVILIVEDDLKFAKILSDLIHERGFKCLAAGDGETGIHFANHYNPSAIMLDIGLPGMNGWAVMERLKDNPDTRHIPVHFMSAADKTLEAMRMGAIGFLSKPVNMEELEKAFKKIEDTLAKRVKNLLVVEDDEAQRQSIRELIGNGDVVTTAVATGEEAFRQLETNNYDCMILDLGLSDMSGFELLEKIRNENHIYNLPVIIYTGKDLSRSEEDQLRQYAESIIIKGVKSPERLLDETTLFLHRLEKNLPQDKQKMLQLVHNKEAILKGKKILLVDDDMRNLFALSSILEENGMEIIIGKNGKDGLQRLNDIPNIDLVLMDIMMPEMDGYEAMRQLRKNPKFKKLPVIALTAKAMKDDRNKCIEAGANDYLSKPIENEKLLSLLRVWLYR